MKKKILRAVLYFAGALLIVIILITIALWVKSPGVTKSIIDSEGNPVEGSISMIAKVTLGGQEQHIIVRGVDTTKPVILFLHGGPGSPEVAFIKHFNPHIEKEYVMVYWEQRGAGKSFSKSIPPLSMNLEQMISDTRELSEYLKC
jgi:pimeloyl-ACP methyl ester carboxylesterase